MSKALEGESKGSVASPPSKWDVGWDLGFRGLTYVFSWLAILLVLYILYEIGGKAAPAVKEHGVGFITDTKWDPANETFGVLPSIWGTLYSSLLALFVGGFFGVAIAIFLTQNFLPRWLEVIFKNIVELLAAIPSVVYGLWGIYVLTPVLLPVANWLHETLGFLPIFGTSLAGAAGMFPAAMVLAIMILPTVSAVSRDAISAVPRKSREAVFGLGATRWQAILGVILPTAATGIFGALVLGFGRALGETMALAMLIGNKNEISVSLFSPGNTLAALLANSFPEADKAEEQALMYAAVVLLAITLFVNIAGTAIIMRASRRIAGTADE